MSSWTLSLHRSCICCADGATILTSEQLQADSVLQSWAAQPRVRGNNAPHFGTNGVRGYRGGGGPMKMIFASMFINATIRQQISIYSIGPTDTCLLVPHILKSGDTNFLSLAPLANPVLYPTLKSAAPPMPPINDFAAPLELNYQNHGPKQNSKRWVQVTRRRQST